ncbi:MAG: NUDIX domain-containing protein [Candidatus Paceibacterota bacterium]
MEYIDILDEKGNMTGESKEKMEIHRDGNLHRTVHIWFVNSKGEILLQHRSKEKINHPDMWDISVAGHISSGESAEVGALREIKEEIGIDVLPSQFEVVGEVVVHRVLNNGTYFDNEFNSIYLIKKDFNIEDIKMQESEVEDMRWLPIEEFKKWIDEKKSDLVDHGEEYALLFKYLSKNQ